MLRGIVEGIGRIRRSLLWCAGGLLAIGVASLFCGVSWTSSRGWASWRVAGGALQIRSAPAMAPSRSTGLSVWFNDELVLWPRMWSWCGMGPAPQIKEWPLWIPAVALLLPVAVIRPRFEDEFRGLCRTCGYDLRGNASGICPECGKKIVA